MPDHRTDRDVVHNRQHLVGPDDTRLRRDSLARG